MNSEKIENCKVLLKIITGKDRVVFTNRGNESIKFSLEMAKKLERQNVLIQDMGGWMYYEKFIGQNNLTPIKLTTNHGIIYEKELSHHKHDSILLLNSLAGYFNMHNMNEVFSSCIQNDCILINDISGSIGTEEAKVGDIIIGSFGIGKPVDLGRGGFVAFDEASEFNLEDLEVDLDYANLELKLKGLQKRREFLLNKSKEIKEDLDEFDIVEKDSEHSLVVVVKFKDKDEKERIINYCVENYLEYTMCPREIRILEDAISIEVKRLKND